MDRDASAYTPFRTGATSSDTPNPLRPYYVPPSIGLPPDQALPLPGNVSGGAQGRYTQRPTTPPRPKGSSLRSSPRDYLPDLDYADYLPERSPSMAETVKNLMDQALWSYTSVLLAHPFDVAKTVLQCRSAANEPVMVQPKAQRGTSAYNRVSGSGHAIYGDGERKGFSDNPYKNIEEEQSDESDSDSPSYFTSTAPQTAPQSYGHYTSSGYPTPPSRSRSSSHYQQQGRSPPRSHSTTPTPGSMPTARKDTHLSLHRPDAVLEVIAQLWQKESAWGVWKGTNATFVYNVLLRTLESWIRSLLAALINLPEAVPLVASAGAAGLAASAGATGGNSGVLDILDSPAPLASLGVTVAAAGLTALFLSPLDIIRTRLMITSTATSPRAILPSFRLLPSWTAIQAFLGPATLLHSTIPSLFTNSAPLLIRGLFRVDPILTPTLYSIASFTAAMGELFIRLPLETVLRRGQVALLKNQASLARNTSLTQAGPSTSSDASSSEHGGISRANVPRELDTIVDVGPFKGVLGTMWYIIREEGTSPPSAASQAVSSKGKALYVSRQHKGQGVRGLWRGWRVGFWGLVGVWGAAALGGGGTGGEF